MDCVADNPVSNFEPKKQKSICCSTKEMLHLLVKELLDFTCSYPFAVQKAKGLISYLLDLITIKEAQWRNTNALPFLLDLPSKIS